jgi:hypothetical protein
VLDWNLWGGNAHSQSASPNPLQHNLLLAALNDVQLAIFYFDDEPFEFFRAHRFSRIFYVQRDPASFVFAQAFIHRGTDRN